MNLSAAERQHVCRVCHRPYCDDGCEELALIYQEQQREKLRDIEIDEGAA